MSDTKYPKDFINALALKLSLDPEPEGLQEFLELTGIRKTDDE